MNQRDAAKKLAEMGFWVFPIVENKKKPPLSKGWQDQATRDPKNIDKIWFDPILGLEHRHNIGISTSKFGDSEGLIVVDVDNKKGKQGSKTLAHLEINGCPFPKTLTQMTPTGGLHLIYKVKEALKQGTDVLGSGLDIRSRGGFIVGAGSMIDGIAYHFNAKGGMQVADAPEWLVKLLKEKENEKREKKTVETDKKISQKAVIPRAKDYLLNSAPVAIDGQGGDHTTFKVAARLKDMGVSQKNAVNLMLDHWNDNCQPPWLPNEIEEKVINAYSYGQNDIGADSPENEFTPIETTGEEEYLDPVEELNKEFSFIVIGGKSTILKQSADGEVNYMSVQAFHDLLKADTIQTGSGRKKQLSQMWFSSPKRATYEDVGLFPNEKVPHGVYNLWRGFAITPLAEKELPTSQMIEGVRLFREHALENVCGGDEILFKWLMGYFAHLIQKPNEKPLTALVFKGQKGVGKNALIERIGAIVGSHYLLSSNRRYLTSNFNKHLANLILFVLDEAFWSGDKQAEGILKDLITGSSHLIEQKGREMYVARNLIRIVIIGNEEWVVPATEDERRFAVFNVGNKRRRDKEFFIRMRECLEKHHGNRLLMRELLNFDLSQIDINEAPETEGLLEQKIESLSHIHAWWYGSLKEGTILNFDFINEEWPEKVGRDQMRAAFAEYVKKRGIKSWLPDLAGFGRELNKCCPSIESRRVREGDVRTRSYILPPLKQARAEFESFIGHGLDWEEDEDSNVIDAAHIFK